MPLTKKQTRIVNKFEKRDKKIGRKFHPYVETVGDLKLYILKRDGRNAKYKNLGIIDNWTAEVSEWRGRVVFQVSTTREDFGENQDLTIYQALMQATHIAKSNGEIYSLLNGDTVEVFQFDFSYKILALQESQLTFSPDTDL